MHFVGSQVTVLAKYISLLYLVASTSSASLLPELDQSINQYLIQYKKYERFQSIEDQELARSRERSIVNTIFESITDETTYKKAFEQIDGKSSRFPEAIADLAFTLQLAWQKKYFQDYKNVVQTQSQAVQAAIVIGLTLSGGIAKLTPEKVKTYFQVFKQIRSKQAALIAGVALSKAENGHASRMDLPPPPSELLSLGLETIPLPRIEILTQELMKDLFIGIEGTLGIGMIIAAPTLQLKALATALLVAYATYSYQQGAKAENQIAEWVAHHPALNQVVKKALYAYLYSSINQLELETDIIKAGTYAKQIIETTTRIVSLQLLTQQFSYTGKTVAETLHENILASEVRKGEFRSDPKGLLYQINAYLQSFHHRNFGRFLDEHYSDLIIEPMIGSLP